MSPKSCVVMTKVYDLPTTKEWFRSERGASILPLIVLGTFCCLLPLVVRPISADTLAADGILRIANYSFADKLQNPCALISGGFTEIIRSGEDIQKTRLAVAKTLKFEPARLKELAIRSFKTNELPDCEFLGVPLIGSVPTAEDLLNTTSTTEALRLFYSQLLHHTAYVYFMKEQLQKYPEHGSYNTAKLLKDAGTLSARMRWQLCTVGIYLTYMPQEEDGEKNAAYIADSTSQVLDEKLMDQPVHSRTLIRNCQIFKSTINLLTELTDYLHGAKLIGDDEL